MAYDYGWIWDYVGCPVELRNHIEYIRASQCEWARLHMDDHGPIPWHIIID